MLSKVSLLSSEQLGSIPTLPTQSCKEIKANEEGQAVSGNSWLDAAGSGDVILAYCDMNTEGLITCHFIIILKLRGLTTWLFTQRSRGVELKWLLPFAYIPSFLFFQSGYYRKIFQYLEISSRAFKSFDTVCYKTADRVPVGYLGETSHINS